MERPEVYIFLIDDRYRGIGMGNEMMPRRNYFNCIYFRLEWYDLRGATDLNTLNREDQSRIWSPTLR